METAEATGLHAEPQPKPSATEQRRKGRFEWIWRGGALKEARARLGERSALELARLQRARAALELADRAFDPIDPLRAGSSVGLSLSLYREAAYWALLAQDKALAATSLRAALEQADQELLQAAVGGQDALLSLRKVLVEKDFVATAEDLEETQRKEAALAKDFVHALVDHKLDTEARVGQLLLQRWTRTVLASLLTLAIVLGSWFAFQQLSKGPDLAAGKAWRPSSTFPGCNLAEQMCNGTRVKFFFHTEEENQPWVRFDLGRRTTFAHVELVNRSDAGSERAFPVVIEISDDGEKWREVSRREKPYATWRADFAPVQARYVRARVLKRTWFHLERFSVYAP